MFVQHSGCHSPLRQHVVLLSKLGEILQRLFNKLLKCFISSSLDVDLSKSKIMIFNRNKRKLNQEEFYLGKDQIELTLDSLHWG